MDDIIRIKNSFLGRYEELLIRRDQIRKEADRYGDGYFREFGDMIIKVFEMKMECIRKKKTITFCQKSLNRGETIDRDALDKFLETTMAEYKDRLEGMIDRKKRSESMGYVSEYELLEIKKIYRRLAKQIHPDINPETEKHPELMNLWNRAVLYYNCNLLKEIKEVEVMVQQALEQLGLGTIEIDIPDIDVKIEQLEKEIADIMNNDPYRYRFILSDSGKIAEKNAELTKEMQAYSEYSAELDKVIEELMMGEKITWQMN